MAAVSLLGIPNDDNSSFMKGPAEAPALIRREFRSDAYSNWSETGIDLSAAGRVVDRGDIQFDGTRDPWDLIEQTVGRVLESGDPLICLGGDHAITHPIMRAVRRHHAPSANADIRPRGLTILHIDAHPDIYHAYQGNPRSHTSPFARIMEERLADRLIQVGLRTINDHHRDQFKRFGVEVIEMGSWSENLRIDITTPVYVSIDLDGLDPAYAPGVSHREPGGPSPRQVINLIHTLDQPIVAADIVEYNPHCDISNMTAIVAAKLLKEVAGMMVRTAR
jgi:agmatinase